MSANSANRKSRRLLDLDPKSCDEVLSAKKRELKSLLSKGGRQGKQNPEHDDWNFFPAKKKTKSMINLTTLGQEIEDMRKLTETQDEGDSFDSTYLLLHVNQIKGAIAHKCTTCEKDKNTIVRTKKLKFKIYGMSSAINLTCTQCDNEKEIPPNPSSFAGKGFSGEPSLRKNNSWYEANLRLVLATLAVGNGASDLSDFSAFLDLPQASSFSTKPFNRIESIVGEHLRHIAEESMHEAWMEETKVTLESENKFFYEWLSKHPSLREIVKLTVSFDMG